MSRKYIFLLKSSIWEILSAILSFIVTYLITSQLAISVTITLVLLVLKSILLALYDYYTSKIIKDLIE